MIERNAKMKSLRKVLVIDAIAIFISVAFIVWRKFSHTLPCLTKTLFKIYCPVCGGTRAVSALLKFDILASLRHNPIVVYIALCMLFVNVLGIVGIKKNKSDIRYPWRPLVHGGVVILAVFFVIKNVLLIFFITLFQVFKNGL